MEKQQFVWDPVALTWRTQIVASEVPMPFHQSFTNVEVYTSGTNTVSVTASDPLPVFVNNWPASGSSSIPVPLKIWNDGLQSISGSVEVYTHGAQLISGTVSVATGDPFPAYVVNWPSHQSGSIETYTHGAQLISGSVTITSTGSLQTSVQNFPLTQSIVASLPRDVVARGMLALTTNQSVQISPTRTDGQIGILFQSAYGNTTPIFMGPMSSSNTVYDFYLPNAGDSIMLPQCDVSVVYAYTTGTGQKLCWSVR